MTAKKPARRRQPPHEWLTDDFMTEVVLRYECGEPQESIAVAIDVPRQRVVRALKERGIAARPARKLTSDPSALFWARVLRGGHSDCWPFMGSRSAKGYGSFNMNGRTKAAPRVAFFFANGYWPNVARHTCDNPPCCNPAHLIDGTLQDNVRDAVERGLTTRGEKHGQSKLTKADVLAIRHRSATTPVLTLAREFDVSYGAVYDIIAGRTWGWL